MSQSSSERAKQVRQAEELLFEGPAALGFGKSLFFGRFAADWVFPYPALDPAEQAKVEPALAEVSQFAREKIDPAAIDRAADIPREIIDGLARLGVLGMTAPEEFGGRGFSQGGYCRILEVLGGRCSATSIFVNAHHSIGIRALLLFGTPEQKQRWLPGLVSGQQLAAFALTEPEAGSDAANVQTQAVPSADGSEYRLTGQKRYITNGAIADVLTVMARTPVPGRHDSVVTAFLVTPDLPGFQVIEPRMEKLGIRGTATARLAFTDMPVPRQNVLGPLGKGLRVALTVLDFGRTTFGACCTGMAKECLRLATAHAATRRQFDRTLGEFELVKKKIARMAAWTYAIEAMTYVTAGLIDRGLEDYMLETAMLKVYSTEALWTIVNDTFQIHGGAAYFTDLPLERMLRDARINQIGEGANDVLRSFIALVGLRGPGEEMRRAAERRARPWEAVGPVWRLAKEPVRTFLSPPVSGVQTSALRTTARRLTRLTARFAVAAWRTLIRHREAVLDRQYDQERLAEAAMELYASACALSRLDAELRSGSASPADRSAADLFLRASARRVCRCLAALGANDDPWLTRAADQALERSRWNP